MCIEVLAVLQHNVLFELLFFYVQSKESKDKKLYLCFAG